MCSTIVYAAQVACASHHSVMHVSISALVNIFITNLRELKIKPVSIPIMYTVFITSCRAIYIYFV